MFLYRNKYTYVFNKVVENFVNTVETCEFLWS